VLFVFEKSGILRFSVPLFLERGALIRFSALRETVRSPTGWFLPCYGRAQLFLAEKLLIEPLFKKRGQFSEHANIVCISAPFSSFRDWWHFVTSIPKNCELTKAIPVRLGRAVLQLHFPLKAAHHHPKLERRLSPCLAQLKRQLALFAQLR
jgi:hypothetical protein